MRKISFLILLVTCLVFPVFVSAGHGHDQEHHHSHGSSFDVDGDEVTIIEHTRRGSDEVVISRDGHLEINGDRIQVDRKSRKLLKSFYKEAVILEDEAEKIGLEAAELATEATSYAAVSVLKALKSLSDEDEFEAELASLQDRSEEFEAMAEAVEERGEEIEAQAEKLVELADKLCARVPELDDLGWFLDRS